MKKHQSAISKVIYQDAEAMHRVGIISDERMREYDTMCLVQPAVTIPHISVSPQTPFSRPHPRVPAYM